MGFKKAFAGMTLAVGAALAPMATKANTETNAAQKATAQVKAEKVAIPDWIPTTADGQFDHFKALDQANVLWGKHGKDIQQFSDDIKAGMPEEIAYTKFAQRLAKGDKDKEKQILSLFDTVQKTREERNGEMNETFSERYRATIITACVAAFLLGAFSDSKVIDKAIDITVLGLGLSMAGCAAHEVLSHFFETPENFQAKAVFVDVQKAFYDAYKQQGSQAQRPYTQVDLNTARQMIKMAQEKGPGK